MTATQSANFQGDPLCQATKRHLNNTYVLINQSGQPIWLTVAEVMDLDDEEEKLTDPPAVGYCRCSSSLVQSERVICINGLSYYTKRGTNHPGILLAPLPKTPLMLPDMPAGSHCLIRH